MANNRPIDCRLDEGSSNVEKLTEGPILIVQPDTFHSQTQSYGIQGISIYFWCFYYKWPTINNLLDSKIINYNHPVLKVIVVSQRYNFQVFYNIFVG